MYDRSGAWVLFYLIGMYVLFVRIETCLFYLVGMYARTGPYALFYLIRMHVLFGRIYVRNGPCFVLFGRDVC